MKCTICIHHDAVKSDKDRFCGRCRRIVERHRYAFEVRKKVLMEAWTNGIDNSTASKCRLVGINITDEQCKDKKQFEEKMNAYGIWLNKRHVTKKSEDVNTDDMNLEVWFD